MISQDMTSASSGENGSDCCRMCKGNFDHLRVLSCLHVFCEGCLKKLFPENGIEHNVINCSLCGQETELSSEGVSGLTRDYISCNRNRQRIMELTQQICTSCKAEEKAVAHCMECGYLLCRNCFNAHQFMYCFESHTVLCFDEMKTNADNVTAIRPPVTCTSHHGEALNFYCHTCHIPICSECMVLRHKQPEHCYEKAVDAENKERHNLKNVIAESKCKKAICEEAAATVDTHLSDLQVQRDNTQSHIEKTFQSHNTVLEKYHKQSLEEIKKVHSSLEIQLTNNFYNVMKEFRKLDDARKFAERLLNCGNTLEVLSLSHAVQEQLRSLINNGTKLDISERMTFETNKNKFESTIIKIFGHVKTAEPLAKVEDSTVSQTTSPMHSSSPVESDVCKFFTTIISSNNSLQSLDLDLENNVVAQYNFLQLAKLAEQSTSQSLSSNTPASVCIKELLNSSNELDDTDALLNEINGLGALANMTSISVSNVLSPVVNQSFNPAARSSSVKLFQLHIRCTFGQLGSEESEFDSPHGFCLGPNQEIIVADTNNHRVQIFEETGYFKYQFGIRGKKEGNLWYPRKVAVIQSSGKIVVCDIGSGRSRMQIFTKTGHFLKKIDIHYIHFVVGLTTTREDRIVVVNKRYIPTVFIISEAGDCLHSFDCSQFMKGPSDIAFYQKEFYICDFKGDCVAVFSDSGTFLRKISCKNVTNFPNGIDISRDGYVLVGDSHENKFHIAVFAKEGSLLCQFELPHVTISQSCGLKITPEGYVITLSKKNNLVLVLKKLYNM